MESNRVFAVVRHASRGDFSLKTGRQIVHPETVMTNLYLSMLDKMGVQTDKPGDSIVETMHLTDL